MNKEFLKFYGIETEKRKFHSSKNSINIINVDFNKIVVSDKFFLSKNSFKYFIFYKNNNEVGPFSIMPPKMNKYVHNYNERCLS